MKMQNFNNSLSVFSKGASLPHNRRGLLGFCLFISVTFLLVIRFPLDTSLKPGGISIKNIPAPRSTTFIDRFETERLREKAALSVARIYGYDSTITSQVMDSMEDIFAEARKIKQQYAGENLGSRVERLREAIGISLTEEELKLLIVADEKVLDPVKTACVILVKKIMERGIRDDRPEDLEQAKTSLKQNIAALPYNKKFLGLMTKITRGVLLPNMIFNKKQTEQKKENEKRKIAPVRKSVVHGELILKKDQFITGEHIEKLRALGLLSPITTPGMVLGISLVNGLFLFLGICYMRMCHPDIFLKTRLLVLLSLVYCLSLALCKLLLPLSSGYLVLIAPAVCGMLLSVLLNPRVSLLMVSLLSLHVGILQGMDLLFTLLSFLSGLCSVYGTAFVQTRSDVAKTSAQVAAVNLVAVIGVAFLQQESFWSTVLNAFYGVLDGVAAGVITIGALSFLEKPFRIVTPIRLLELANPREPFLSRLMQEAPGTYNHTMYVGNLAEAAASAVGANALMVRVGAYYHDIGKLNRPFFFIENQISISNPHEGLRPELSAVIIKNHVSEGVELAKRAGIPEALIPFITEHHGTSPVGSFYHKAHSEAGEELNGTSTDESSRYDGPKPQTKETGILMLADSVEAAVRSMKEHDPEKIQEMVKTVIRGKLNDNQLLECGLTLGDLEKIQTVFQRLLEGMYHPRIPYETNKPLATSQQA